MQVTDVTPFVGVWIEIVFEFLFCSKISVTPFVGVWIEITKDCFNSMSNQVTPFVGVWIEILREKDKIHYPLSLPSWECGLKLTFTTICIHIFRHSLRGSVD